jgi:hypothetical protein
MNTHSSNNDDQRSSTVLLLTQRRIADLVAYSLVYEFEDTVQALTDGVCIEVTDRRGLELSRRAYRVARMASGSWRRARRLAPYPRTRTVLRRDFELFFPMFSHTHELYGLATIPNWRERCGKAACFITEVWSDQLPEYLVELLAQFDHIFLGFRQSVQQVARITGRPCSYLPLATDVVRFAPASLEDPRPIDLCNIGRRSPITHRALLQEAERRAGFFYYYDTVAASGSDMKQRTFRVDNAAEHRRLLASLLKRSRYYITHRSRVNEPEFTTGREEISARFYEGAAAGTVMIGDAPRSEEFDRQFDWPHAVIRIPFDAPDIANALANLDSDPALLATVRRTNVHQAAVRHDWVHRIRVVFNALGLPCTEAMEARVNSLEQIAARAAP